MKKIVTLILLSCITLISVAQVVVDPKGTKVSMDSSKWKISGNDIYTKNTGNVGIGTSNPAYKLDVSAAANPVRIMGVQNGSSSDSVITIVNGVIKKVAASSFNRNDSTTANNGLTLTGKNIQLGGTLTQSTTIATAGNALNITGLIAGASTDSILSINTTTGKISRINPSSLITATTNNLALSGNTLTSTVNGIASTSNAVSSVSNTSATNTLTTSVNGVAATGVNIINSNALGITNGALTSTVNGVASSPVNVLTTANNGLTATNGTVQLGGTLNGATTIATSGNALNITGLTSGASSDSLVTVNTTTGKISRINPSLFINNDSTTATNGLNIIGKDVQLGGNLTKATTITNNSNALTIATGGTAMNITGLTSGASTDSIVTINQATGKLNMINRSSILAGSYINNTSTPQASSNFNISGNGTVGGNLSITGIPAGSMLYMNANGRISGVTNNLYYDTITKSMGIGTNAPVRALDVVQNNATSGIMKLQNTNANGYSSIDIWDNTSTQVGNIGYANNGGAYGGSFYFATNTTKNMVLATNNTERLRISGTNGNIGIGVATPTASLHLDAGTAAASTAPLKFTSGTLLSTPEAGAVEFDGNHYYGTISGTRYQLDQQSAGAATTASNGLNKSGNDIRLGGSLTAATTIGTSSTNTLNITGLQTGTTSDSLVTILNGKISKISQAVIQDSTTAGNGLTLSGLNVQLGGTLSQATTIATAGNALNITGLTAGASTDSILTITNAGKINRINRSSITSATTNTLGLSGNTLTSTVNGIAATSNAVSGVSNTSSANTLTTTVNGVTGTSVNMVNSISNASSGNNLTTTVNGIAATAVPMVNTISNTSSGNNLTTTVNGVAASAVPMVNSVSNTLSGSNLTTTVNGVTGSSVNLSGLVPTTSHSLALSGNTLTSVVNGISASSNAVSGVSNTTSANTLTTTVNGVTGTAVSMVNSISNSSSGNNLTTTVNGITGTAVPMVNTVSNNLSGSNLTTTVNGVTGAAINLAGMMPTTTNTLAISGNTLTSTVNGIAATSNAVSGVSNTSSANTLTTTVNGVTGSTANIINTNTLGLSNGTLTSTVNGVASSTVNVLGTANNGLTATNGTVQLGGSLTSATTIATAGNALNITGLTAGSTTDSIVTINTTTGKLNRISASALSVSAGSNTASNGLTLSGSDIQLGGTLSAATTLTTSSTNTLSLLGVQTGTTADSLLVLGTNSEIKKVVQMPTTQFAIVNSDLSLTSSNAAQSALPSDRNTFTAVGSTIYEVEGSYIMTTGTSNNKTTAISFGGTATANYVALNAIGWNSPTGTTTATQGSTAVITLSSTVITASSNVAGVHISFKGIISVNAGGTLIPQITFSNGPGGTNTMKAGSYIKFTPLLGSVNGSFN